MKRAFLIIGLLSSLGLQLKAETFNLGETGKTTNQNVQVQGAPVYGQVSPGVWRALTVDSSGNLVLSGATYTAATVNQGLAGSAAWRVVDALNVTNTASIAASLTNSTTVSSSVAPVPINTNFIGYRSVTQTSFTTLSLTTSSFSLTFSAGVNNGKPMVVSVVGISGMPNGLITYSDSATAPPTFTGANGMFVPMNTTLERFGPEQATSAGRMPYFHIRAQTLSAAAAVIYFEIWEKL